MAESRLSPYNINDPILRVELYREIRTGQDDTTNDWEEYEVEPADELSPDLISYKVYRTKEMKWAVCIAAKLDNMRERIDAGTILKLPPLAWTRERIKYYVELEEKLYR